MPTLVQRFKTFFRSVENSNLSLTGKRILEVLNFGSNESGVTVNEQTALTYSAVYCSTRVIAESIAQLPLQLFKRTETGREVQVDHPLYKLVHSSPNNFQTSFTFRELLATRQCLAGNGYAFIKRNRQGKILELIPFPVNTQIDAIYDEKRRKVRYVINGDAKQVVDQVNMLHILALSTDGITGVSPVALAKQSYGLGMVQEKFASRFFGRGANPDYILEHPAALSDQARTNIKKSWATDAAGINNSFTPRVLEEGMKVTKMSIPPEEAQFLESRKFSKTEVATWYRIPPHMINDLERATFSNVEQQDINFVKYSIMPHLKRWEQELDK